MVTLANPFLPHVDMLGLHEELVGHNSLKWITTPGILARVETGNLQEVASGEELNTEALIRLQPDLIMANAIGDSGSDVHNRLITMGLQVVVNADYMETTPLGRAEWLKFMAVFFNAESEANRLFDQIATDYTALATAVATEETQPTVLVGAPFRGVWYAPGGQSNVAHLIADAGGRYVWADDPSSGSQSLDVETVLRHGGDATIWINTGIWTSIQMALDEDARYTAFTAMREGQVYNHVRTQQENGANDYWEGAMARPDLLLRDMVKILHPELLPEHELIWYKNLD
jgi:iron complex transport system substrate-binding protein